MRKPVIHPALAADALTAVAVAALGLLLLRGGAEILQALPASGARSGPSVSPESFELLAGLCAAGTGMVLTVWWVGGLICAAAGGILVRCGMSSAGHRTMLQYRHRLPPVRRQPVTTGLRNCCRPPLPSQTRHRMKMPSHRCGGRRPRSLRPETS